MARRIVQDTNVYAGSLIPAIGGSNMVSAWDMESGVSGWTGTNATPTQDATIFRSGSKSLKVVVSSATGSVSYTTASQTSGKRYYVDFWVKGDANSNSHFLRVTLTANGDNSTQDTVKYQLSNTSWTRIRCSIYNTVTGTITIKIAGVDLANTWAFYVDDGYMDYVTTPTTSCANRLFLYNDVSTYLRGCNYNNTPTEGANGANFATEEGMLPFDFADLQTQGVNMIRIYNNAYNANDYGRGLDCAWNYGIGVMLLYFLWISSTDYTQATGTTNRNTKTNDFANTWVSPLKSHPAIIAFGFGSEGNFHVSSPNTQTDWFTLVDAACVAGKAIDPSRVFYTSNGGLPVPSVDSLMPNLDMLGYTHYGGSSANIHRGSNLNGVDALIAANTTKAVILTEIGTGMYQTGYANGNQEWQGTSDVALLSQAESFFPLYVGHTYFQFSDDRGDTSEYGKSETVAGGSTTTRTKRGGFSMIQNFFKTHPVPGY